MKKHAYLIMAHNEFHMLKKLLHELDDYRNDIYIHIDKKVRYVNEEEIASWIEKSRVFFIPRMKIHWGTFSIVKCEIALLEAAVGKEYAYYHLLSGVDFPLKNQTEIHDFLEDENGEFIDYHCDGELDDHYLSKVKYYFPLIRFVGKGLFEGPGKKIAFMKWLNARQYQLTKYQRVHGVDRTKRYKSITFYKGAQWFTITHDFARFFISQKRKLTKMYWLTNGSDEFVLQTLAMNSEFSSRVRNENLREIDWIRGGPYEYTENDLKELSESKAFFARKISYDKHPLLVNRLIANLHESSVSDTLPLVSVIVPCYNVEKYLAECVESIVHQTYTNIEILLIDDGSTDDTAGIAKEYAGQYENVFYHYRENGGLSAARNTGIEQSHGEYLAFVDSDDWVDEHYIERLYNAICANNADIAVCGYVKEGNDKGSVTFDCSEVISPFSAMRILGDIYPKENVLVVLAWNKLYKRKLFDTVRYPEGKVHEDEYIAHRLVSESDSLALISDCLYHYRIREDGITGSSKTQNLNHLDCLGAFKDRLECCDSMMFQELFIYMLYTYFEGLKQLMATYTDDTIRKNRLYALFKKRALYVYLKYFGRLNGFQKRDYLKLILMTEKYRNTVISLGSEK